MPEFRITTFNLENFDETCHAPMVDTFDVD